MKRTHLFLLLVVLVSFYSCIEHQKERESEPKKPASSTLRERHYKTVRVYNGVIPCADCSGIIQKLVLKGDSIGIYRLTETYKDAGEDGDAVIISSGEWKLITENNAQQLYLSQGSLQDSARIMRYEYNKSVLHQFELDGAQIESKFAYTLRLEKKQ
jgi:copper homeostasis protein (lipoprotein)